MKHLVEKLRETLKELGFAGELQPIDEAFRREMDSVRELMAGIAWKSSEISIICRGFVNPNNSLYRGQAHTARFHALCLEWAGHCLAYAQPGSHEYALGLKARANLHCHCGNWSDCARDVIRAQDRLRLHKFPDPLGTAERLSELMSRVEAKAGLKTEPNSDMNGWQPVDLADSPDQLVPRLEQSHPEHPCLSVSVAPAYDPFLGRHLVARRDIKVGEMILVEDMACCSLLEDKLRTSCAHCSAPAWRGGGGQACPECANVLYCSEECRDEARSDYHDVECPIFAEASRRREDRESVLAALRLLVKYAKAEGLDRVIEIARVIDRDPESFNMKLPKLSEYLQPTDSSFCYTEFGKIYGLLDRHISPENEEQFRYMMTAMDIPPRQTDEFPDDEYDDLLGAVVKSLRANRDEDIDDDTMWAVRKIFKKLKMIYEVNCHWFGSVPDEKSPTKSDWEIKCFALSYYTSLINHSCFQNSALSIGKGGKLMVYAIHPIKQSEQITINYGHRMDTSWGLRSDHTRRKHVAEVENFICLCVGCNEGWAEASDSVNIDDLVRPEVEACAKVGMLEGQSIDWYLTKNQIIAVKIVIGSYFERLKKTAPWTAFHKTRDFMKFLIHAYELMYGVERKVSKECHSC